MKSVLLVAMSFPIVLLQCYESCSGSDVNVEVEGGVWPGLGASKVEATFSNEGDERIREGCALVEYTCADHSMLQHRLCVDDVEPGQSKTSAVWEKWPDDYSWHKDKTSTCKAVVLNEEYTY